MPTDLITLAEYKEYKGVKSTSDDTKTSALITRVSEFIKRFTNKTFIDYSTAPKTEYHNVKNEEWVLLGEIPIINVSSVATSIDGGVTQTDLDEDVDFFTDKDLGMLFSNSSTGYFTTTGVGHKSLEVTYTGGYTETPSDIKQAALDLVSYYLDNEFTPKRQFSQTTIENFSFRAANDVNLPGHIRRILEFYREL